MIFDESILDYALEVSEKETDLLKKINRETYLKTAYPNMLSGPVLGGFLRMISRILQPKVILEIGTFTGYSCLCLADGLADGGVIHTIERNEEMIGIINENLKEEGLGRRIFLHQGDALEIIPSLDLNIDLAFIDGEKSEYIDYYEALLPKMKAGAVILADNVLWGGKVISRDIQDKDTQSIRSFNQYVLEDIRTNNFLLPIRDGLMVIHKKP